MLPGNHKTYNIHAFKQLIVDVDLPKPELGIEYAENHSFYKIKFVVEKNQPRVVIPELDELPWEQAQIDQQGNILNEKDFPKTHWLGSSLGGI
jgi:hypothetical protein